MKIILSRKGFDSASGGVPSPIMLPSRTLVSIPIPSDKSSNIKYEDISSNGRSLGRIVEDLSVGQVKASQFAHLDPDLIDSAYPRLPGWHPMFGQCDAAQSHLANKGVTIGDLFLFFGWFREAEFVKGKYRFVKNAPNLHVIYGWLQVGKIISVDTASTVPPWARYHHHFHAPPTWRNNTVYISSEKLRLNDFNEEIPGAGVFENYREELCLTCPGQQNRSLWKLPRWFYPGEGLPPLSYHLNESQWMLEDDHAILSSVGRGQEFVLDANHYPEAITWVRDLMMSRSNKLK